MTRQTNKRALLIFNPFSGSGDSPLPEFIGALGALGWTVQAEEIREGSPEDWREAARGCQAVIAAGGDGTVSSVAYALRDTEIPLLAYPAGTANLIAQNLELPGDPEELARIVEEGHTLTLDLGELEIGDEGGKRHGFVMLAGAGADANMIGESEDLKERFGPMAYLISAMRQFSPKKTVFTIRVGDRELRREGIGVMVANLGMANLRIPITTDISPLDGEFTVIVIRAGNILQLIPNLIDSLRAKFDLGDPMFSDNLETFHAREVSVTADDPFPMQYDGELLVETTPFTARVLPGAARFLTRAEEEELET